jgi:hypothetical protein
MSYVYDIECEDLIMKKCTQCKKVLDVSKFIQDEIEYKRCNECRKYANEYYTQDRLKHPEKYKNFQKTHRKNNLEKRRRQDRILQKKYRDENPEKYREERRAYNEKNKDKLKSYDEDRMLNRPEYFLFSSARNRARKRNLEFTITEQDIKNLLNATLVCPLRKSKFDRGTDGKPNDNSVSLDRINSSRGYVKDNIQIISYRANVIKSNIDLKTFEKIVNNFENLKLEIHGTDDNIRDIIIRDRLNFIEEGKPSKKEISRIMNIETGLLGSARKRARKNNLELNIDKNYIKSIWPVNNKCPILENKFVFGKDAVSDLSATIDRIDNGKGYIEGNVMIISAKANSVKNKATLEELKFILKNWEELEKENKQ